MALEIIFSDNHLLVINKPPGLLTQPNGTEQESLEELAKEWVRETCNKQGNVYLHAVHRIDKPVSGVVLFARTSKALSRLQEAMRSKHPKKLYWAIVEGVPQASEGILEHYLVHDDHIARSVPGGTSDAKLARLSYHVVKAGKANAMVEISLETGRYHQIRAQFAAIGCPIVGDVKYGATALPSYSGIALHHRCLEIPHPITEEIKSFAARLPASWPFPSWNK